MPVENKEETTWRYSLLSVITSISLLFCFYVIKADWYSSWVEKNFYESYYNEIKLNITALRECKIPSYDPFDETILKFIEKSPPLNCKGNQPRLLKFNKDSLWFDEDVLKRLGTRPEDYQCKYFEVHRRTNPLKEIDRYVDIGKGIEFNSPVVIDKDYVMVNCSRGSKLVYNSTLLKVTTPSQSLLNRVLPSSGKRPSIFILGFDSTSRLNFLRQMKKTSKFMEETLNGVYFRGLNKNADNTKPNIGIILTGRYVFKPKGKEAPSLEDVHPLKDEFWDDLPFVMKNFTENGFSTMYFEDDNLSTFVRNSIGFREAPTDYYSRPFILALEKLPDYDSDFLCYDGIPKHKYYFPYMENFVSMFKKKRFFSFSFITDYSHYDLGGLQHVDEDVWQMFNNMRDSGALENTIVILLGDHGCRSGKIRQSVVGRFEDLMPLFVVALPENLKKEYPHLQKGLESNADTLLSWFDIYELLMDVATGNFEEKSKVERYGFLGLSPFRTIPRNRSCYQIGISMEYCICNEEYEIPPSDDKVRSSANTMVTYLNLVLPPVCALLTLHEILNADIMKPNAGFEIPRVLSITYRIVIVVNPSKAVLEGNVKHTPFDTEIVGEISRLNSYVLQSHCILNDDMNRKFCYCKDQLK